MKESVKNIFNFFLRFGLSAILLWYVLSKVDIARVKKIVLTADVSILIIALAIFLVINCILLFRWFIFLRALGVNAPLWQITRNLLVGLFGNLFLPSSVGGDILKTLGLCKGSEHKGKVVASVLLDRLSGFASIVIIAVVAFVFGFRMIGDTSVLIAIAVLAIGSLGVALVLFNERIYSFGCKIFAPFPKIEKTLMNLHYDIALMKNKKKEGYQAIALSCLSQTTFAFMWFILALSLHQQTNLLYFIIFVPLTNVASSVPSIGGLGVREMGAAYLFSKVGMDPGIAVSISLMCYAFMVLIGILGGLIYVFTLSSRRTQHHAPDAGIGSEGA